MMKQIPATYCRPLSMHRLSHSLLALAVILLALILSGCGATPTSSSASSTSSTSSDEELQARRISTPVPPTATPATPANTAPAAGEDKSENPDQGQDQDNSGESTDQDTNEATTPTTPAPIPPTVTLLPAGDPPPGAEREFSTDFSKHIVPYDEILSGGPPKDGIPALDNPTFISVSEANQWLNTVEPVIQVQVNHHARAYPLQILMWHEIVNDTVGDVRLMVSFCPLCNTAIVFERTVDGQVLDFGTTGRLRYSNLVMYDRQTETWWQQATGQAIAGDLTGTQLPFYPAEMVAWEDFKTAYPDGEVLSKNTGYNRSYGSNPYAGYDNVNSSPFLYDGPDIPDDTLPPMARVLKVDINGEAVAYPFDTLRDVRVVNDTVGTEDVGKKEIVVFWEPGTASALDSTTVAGGRDVGSANAYERTLDGQELTFTFTGEQMVDNETGSVWDGQGRAISGTLQGEQLEPVVAVNHFWFSWAAFRPETRIYQP